MAYSPHTGAWSLVFKEPRSSLSHELTRRCRLTVSGQGVTKPGCLYDGAQVLCHGPPNSSSQQCGHLVSTMSRPFPAAAIPASVVPRNLFVGDTRLEGPTCSVSANVALNSAASPRTSAFPSRSPLPTFLFFFPRLHLDTSTFISHGFQELEGVHPRLSRREESVRPFVTNALSSIGRCVGLHRAIQPTAY